MCSEPMCTSIGVVINEPVQWIRVSETDTQWVLQTMGLVDINLGFRKQTPYAYCIQTETQF